MGCKKYSEQEERQIVQEYINGASVQTLMKKYGFATKKSITDKVKKYCSNPEEEIQRAKNNRKSYSIDVSEINSPFNAYFIGLMITDGYIINKNSFGLQLTDEDCIKYISEITGKPYYSYEQGEGHKNAYRITFNDENQVKKLARYGIVERKSFTVSGFEFKEKEIKYLPYLVRGIIDANGCIHNTTKNTLSFYVCSASKPFILWLKDIFENRFFMEDMHIREVRKNFWVVETSLVTNVYKLMAIIYNKPFGMYRKYNHLREMFRDYNKSNQDDFIWSLG